MEQKADALQPPPSNSLCIASVSLPALESGQTSARSSNSTPLSSDPELNDALHELEMCNRVDMAASDGMTPSSFHLFHFPFSLIPLPQSTDLPSQGMSQPLSAEQRVDMSTSTTDSGSLPTLTILDSNTSSVSSTHTPEPDRNNAPYVLLDDKTCGREDTMASGDMTPTNDLPLFLCPLTPLFQSIDLPLQGASQPPSLEQVEDILQLPRSIQSHPSSLDCLPPLPVANSSLRLPPSPKTDTIAPSSSANSDPEMCTFNNENSGGEKMTTDNIMEYFFSLIPLPQSTELPSQGMSQPLSAEQGIGVSTSTVHSTTSSSLSTIDSSTTLPQPSTCAPVSLTHSRSEVCTVDENSSQEKMAFEMGFIFDLFSLIPPSQTKLPSKEVSQSKSMEQRPDMLQPPMSYASHDLLPNGRVTNLQRENSSPSPQYSNCSSIPEDKDTTPVCAQVNTNSPRIPEKSQSASTEQSIAGCSPVLPSADFLKKNITTEDSSTQTCSQTEADSSVEAQKCMNNKRQKHEGLVGTVTEQQQQQRRLNNVSALHYRRRKKKRDNDLEVTMKELGAKNKRLKEQVSGLITEIDKMRKLLLNKAQKSKVCPFFLNSSCSDKK